ncbi:PfkB family carbohydrate kinase [Streptomyces sp. SBT349]|uniref:PfkB family carbohydrate kinase n=1 Tax=Streptomyces sp. SBT349 TaxID=1580539 RepID=UPI001F41EAE6|nr:PfkB family carbohydrate kinase [Streptomyces sp. SBT349]
MRRVPAFPARVVDPTGAEEAFAGAVMAAHLAGTDLPQAVATGTAVAPTPGGGALLQLRGLDWDLAPNRRGGPADRWSAGPVICVGQLVIGVASRSRNRGGVCGVSSW